MLCKTKASSVPAILILAVGIGASTAVFTFLDRLLYRPLPVPKPSQLLLISNATLPSNYGDKPIGQQGFSYEAYVHLRDHNQVFSGLAAVAMWAPRERRLREKIERPAEA